MVMHDECLEDNFRSVEILRETNLNQAAHPPATQSRMEGYRVLQGESREVFREVILLVMKLWLNFRATFKNKLGGHDFLLNAQQLAADVLSWFTQPQELLYLHELEYLIHMCMLSSFNEVVEDGTIEWVAKQLFVMHKECLEGNFRSLEKLRKNQSLQCLPVREVLEVLF